MVIELKPMQETMDNIASRHLDFIKSGGEKGESATASLAAFEKSAKNGPGVLSTLRTEYSVIEALASTMKAEIERMEEES